MCKFIHKGVKNRMAGKSLEDVTILKILHSDIKELDENMKIARYMGRKKFYDIIRDKSMWFSNITEFLDNKERQPRTIKSSSQRGKEIIENIMNHLIEKCEVYVSCWTKFNQENYAMWKLYDKNSNGVCIVTTIGKLKEQLPQNVVLDEVRYDQGSGVIVPNIYPEGVAGNYLASEFAKIGPYKYEDEVRAVFYSVDKEKGVQIPLDFKELITDIYISPFANEKTVEELRKKISTEIGEEKIAIS